MRPVSPLADPAEYPSEDALLERPASEDAEELVDEDEPLDELVSRVPDAPC